jgi:hypothetical protein
MSCRGAISVNLASYFEKSTAVPENKRSTLVRFGVISLAAERSGVDDNLFAARRLVRAAIRPELGEEQNCLGAPFEMT